MTSQSKTEREACPYPHKRRTGASVCVLFEARFTLERYRVHMCRVHAMRNFADYVRYSGEARAAQCPADYPHRLRG